MPSAIAICLFLSIAESSECTRLIPAKVKEREEGLKARGFIFDFARALDSLVFT